MIAAWSALLLAQAAMAAPATAAPPVAAQTTQQAFDAALMLDAKGDPGPRIAAWHALAGRVRGNARTLALIEIHEGLALSAAARADEGEVLVRRGLAGLPTADATLRVERYDGTIMLAGMAERRLDYADAASRFAQAEKLSEGPAERFGALLGEVRTATYTDPDAALAAVARADALAATLTVEPKVMGMLRRFHAELLLNRGDTAGARLQAAAAVKLMGGLTTRTDSNDVSVRSDYAIAALLLGKGDEAREYLAMTGAGRMPNGIFGRGVDTPVPDCGGEAGLKPADLAVVEFTVADDGRTVGVRPVYAAGGGAVALEFARAVANWSWTPEQLAQVPTFFRNRVRLELRCSTSFQRPSVQAYLDERLGQWLTEHDVEMPPVPTGSDAAVLPEERRQLAAAEARHGGSEVALVPMLHLVARNRVTPDEERHAVAVRELAILEARQAPAVVRLGVDLTVAESAPDRRGRADERLTARYAGDAEAAAALALAEADEIRRNDAKLRLLLRPVAENTALGSNPVRTAALIRLASLEQRTGRPEAARALYTQAAIPPESCALIDASPHLLHAGGQFPTEAARWGFEGWALLQFDISAEGRVGNERAIIAYPPFVFTKAALATMAGAQYARTYRPDGQLGCGGGTSGVRFQLPGTH